MLGISKALGSLGTFTYQGTPSPKVG